MEKEKKNGKGEKEAVFFLIKNNLTMMTGHNYIAITSVHTCEWVAVLRTIQSERKVWKLVKDFH